MLNYQRVWSQSKHSRSNNEHRPTCPLAPRLSPLAMVFFSSGNQWDGETLRFFLNQWQPKNPNVWSENLGESWRIIEHSVLVPAWDLLRVPARWLSSIVTSKETDPWNLWISKIGDMGWLIWKIYTTWCGSRILFFCRDPGATAQVWATTSRAFIPLWSIFLTQTCQVQLPKMAASTCHRNIIW